MEAGFLAGDVVPAQVWGALQGGGEGEVSGSPSFPGEVCGGDRDEGESDFVLLTEADGGDGALFWVPEEAEVLLHARPLPPAVRYVLKAGFFHAGCCFDGIGEEGWVWSFSVAQAVVERHA